MELIYVCKLCDRENKIEAEKLLASKELVCESCRHRFALTSNGDASERWDTSLNVEQERAACYHDRVKALFVFAGRENKNSDRQSFVSPQGNWMPP